MTDCAFFLTVAIQLDKSVCFVNLLQNAVWFFNCAFCPPFMRVALNDQGNRIIKV